MGMNKIEYRAIGVIHSPFKLREGIPRQAAGAMEVRATIEIRPEYREGLVDLEGFSHVVVLFHMHLLKGYELTAHPPWDAKAHGVFSTCSPFRPNGIGLSVVKLERIVGQRLEISGVDMAHETPVLDIKPYVPALYPRQEVRLGWLTDKVGQMNRGKTGQR